MIDIKRIDEQLYKSIYIKSKKDEFNELWSKIKKDPIILREAVIIEKDRFGERDLVKGLTISDTILRDYNAVDKIAYQNLINLIYSNTSVARIVMDGASNGGMSFLLLSLYNHNLKLTEFQKKFAVNEAMNKIGTTRWKQKKEEYLNKLKNKGISNDNTIYIDTDNCINPVGAEAGMMYMNYIFSSLSNTQAHGVGDFDIRYHILRNPNWSLEEKQKLIMDFWYNDDEYDEYLEQWEWGIVNDDANFKGNIISSFEKSNLYEYTYEELLEFYKDKETTNRIWNEIQFCKQMHELRPQQWELAFSIKKKKLIQTNIKN